MTKEAVFNENLAKTYIGKYILVGIIYQDHTGKEVENKQIHGTIKTVSKETGIQIELKGVNEGKIWSMPPDMRSISGAEPGTYTLNTTGEKIEDPDLLCTWLIRKPKPADA